MEYVLGHKLICEGQNDMMLDKSKGFTLIEMAIVLMVMGVMIAAAVSAYRQYATSNDIDVTIDHIDRAQSELREFYGLRGGYPCPARPDAAPGDADYGVAAAACRPEDACPAGLVCTTDGTRDADKDGNPDRVVIGVLPFQTLADNADYVDFKAKDGVDGFKTLFTYAVSSSMTVHNPIDGVGCSVSRPCNVQLGAIALKDEFGRNTLNEIGTDAVDNAATAHYVIVSHGDNRKGGYSSEGGLIDDCTFFNTASGTDDMPAPGNNIGDSDVEIEIENCDRNDGIFVKGLRSMADNDNYYDDIVYFNTSTANVLWRKSNFDPLYQYNTNYGNVGVGVSEPLSKLHISGNLKAETSLISDGGYCAADDGNDCLQPSALMGNVAGGTGGMTCPPGQMATGIENNQLVCRTLFTSTINFACPNPGEYVQSFTNNGNVTCAPP